MDVKTATSAFVSFRDSLDTADVQRFPEDEFGSVNMTGKHSNRLNGKRFKKIAQSMAPYGARVDDVKEASAIKSVVQKKGMHLNDVGYRIWPGNYGKYLLQINASDSSVGYWRVGPRNQGYGRFARGLDHKNRKTAIRTALEPFWSLNHRGPQGQLRVTVRVAYYDAGNGSWTLSYPQPGGGRGIGMRVKLKNEEKWNVASAEVVMAPRDGSGEGLEDFELRSPDAADVIFSLLEVAVCARVGCGGA